MLDFAGFRRLEGEWNRLAAGSGTVFLTHEWLTAWWQAHAEGAGACVALWDNRGELRAATVLARAAGGVTESAANDESGDWGVVAADDQARAAAWNALAELGAGRVLLDVLPEDGPDAPCARHSLRRGGYRLIEETSRVSPLLTLPQSWEDLVAGVSRNLRSQLGRRKRAMEREGRLVFRVSRGDADLERDLNALFDVEAAGWKTRNGTAIRSDPTRERLYRTFAASAARQGWLRLYFLELDGVPVAADYGCAFGNRAFLLKTGFDERYSRLSPGLVLRGEVLRSVIEEGARSYDFLGGSEEYKLRWATETRPRLRLRAYRGAARAPAYAYRRRVRPVLKRVRASLPAPFASPPER